MFDSKLPISFYKEVAMLNEEHKVSIVQHIETNKIYVKKVLSVYNMDVYEQLFRNPVRHVPRIYAMYESEGTLTLIEEYVPGETLQEILDLNAKLTERDVVSIAINLCDILTELHSQSPALIHRDIKPSNVMLTEDERVYLLDLNAARIYSEKKEKDTRLIGTEGFAAPEQFGFGDSSSQTDIYAVGNLIKAMLGDRTISPKLNAIVNKCLEISPKDRFQTAGQLKKQLTRVYSHL